MRCHIAILTAAALLTNCGLKVGPNSTSDGDTKKNEVTKPEGLPPSPDLEDAGPGGPAGPGQTSVMQNNVDLTGIVGFALTETSGGANLQTPQTSDTATTAPSSGVVSERPSSNIFGFDVSGQSRPIRFSSGSISFKKIIPTPKALFFIPGDYFGVQNSTGQTCRFLVLTIQDGKLFCMTDFGIQIDSRYEKEYIQASKNGDLVTAEGWENGGWSKLFRMDFSVPGAISVTKIYDKEGYPEQWSMNQDGDVLVQYEESGRKLRALKANGAFDPLGQGEYVRCLHAGKGAIGNSFFYLNSDGGTNRFVKIEKNAQGVFETMTFKSIAPADNLGFIFDGCESSLIEESRSFYAMAQRENNSSLGDPSQAWNGSASIVELTMGTSPAIVRHLVTGFRYVKRILRAPNSPNKLIIVGTNQLGSGLVVAYDTVLKIQVTLLSTGRFVIQDSSVDGNGIRFTGERQSDSSAVSALISNLTTEIDPTTTVVGVQKPKQIVPMFRP